MEASHKMTDWHRYKYRILIGCFLSLLMLLFIFNFVYLSDLKEALLKLNPSYILPITLLIIAFFVLKAIRWQWLLEPVSKQPLSVLFPTMMASVTVNVAISTVVGEVVRCYILGKKYSISKFSILSTIFLERLFDIFILLVFLTFVLDSLTVSNPIFMVGLGFTILLLIGGLIGVFVIWKDPTLSLVDKLIHFIPIHFREKGIKRLESSIEGMRAITSPRLLVWITLISIVQWLIMAYVHYLSYHAIGIDAPFAASILIMGITVVGMALPTSPGYIGIFELGFVLGLKAFGVHASDALAAAIVYHVLYLIVICLIGFPSWKFVTEKKNEA